MDTQHPQPARPAPVATDGLGFPVVGIGASAGGYPALGTLLQNMPAAPGMALVVVLHLPADQRSSADRVLQASTGLPVVQVKHTTAILPNHVYVIPPDRCLKLHDGCLLLDELPRVPGDRTTIDVFFRTLAVAHRENAIGVVLSGMGADGTAGLACIKEQGGVTIVQLPADAEASSMPRSAIESGMADFVLTAAQIPVKLTELRGIAQEIRRQAPREGMPAEVAPFDLGPDPGQALHEVLSVLHAHTGHDFRDYKQPTLLRRLERRLQVRGLADLPGYCRLLKKDASESQALLKDLLIGVTCFFRDRQAFEALERTVLPGLFHAGPSDGAARDEIRVWVAACSTGEEAYSLAMLLADQAAAMAQPPRFQIFATDIDTHALDVARAGVYPASIAADVAPERLERYFTRENGGYKVRKALRKRVLFAEHNLLHDPAFSRLDLISCRNFLIYLNREMHQHILGMFHFSLHPGGFLMLGSAETIDDTAHLFAAVDAAQCLYRAKPVSRSGHREPVAPGLRLLRIAATARQDGRDEMRHETPHEGQRAPHRGRLFSFAEIHLHKAAALAPPSVLVNADGDVVHVAEQASRFLRLAGGEPTRDIVSLVAPELRLELRTALFQAQNSGEQVRTAAVRCRQDDGNRRIDMTVLPFHDQHAEGRLTLVTFHEHEDVPAPPAAEATQDHALLHRLDEELRHTRRKLQETMDQAERCDAEMRTAMEELQTTVEELRAANQELESRNAELQSVNEEFKTVIGQMRAGLEESNKTNDDLSNLIASSDVATLFLDRAMRILRYTPRVADLFNVIPADVGRPLPHITNRLDQPELASEAARVFETLQPMEREVRSNDGRSYIVRVHPYRTSEDRIEGAVMTFFDITSRRAAEEALRASEARLAAVFDALPVGVGVTDAAGALLLANVEMRRYLPSNVLPSRDEARLWRWHGYLADGSGVEHDAFPGARALRGDRVVPGIDMRYTNDTGTETWTQVAAVPIRDGGGAIVGQVSVVTDIDHLKRTEAALRDSERRLQQELAGSALLHRISTELIGEQDVAALYGKIVDAAVQLMHSPIATMQMLCEDADGALELRLLACHGVPAEAAAFWQRVRVDSATSCGGALASGRRVVVPDVEQCAFLKGTSDLDMYRKTGIRSMQTTPLHTRDGKLVGMISTHCTGPHAPSERELALLDILARQAADLVERTKREETPREGPLNPACGAPAARE